MTQKTFTVGIVGHIDLEDPASVKLQVVAHLQTLKEKYPQLRAYSSLAAGSDTLFAQAALELGIPLTILLPFEQNAYADTIKKSGISALNTFSELIQQGEIVTLSKQVPANEEEQNALFKAGGQAMVDTCDALIFIWDGYGQHGTGGTAGTHKYAVQQHKVIHLITAYRSGIYNLFTERDTKANAYKKKYEKLWKWSLVFSVAAALLLAITVALSLHDKLFTIIEVSLVILAFCFAMIIRGTDLKFTRFRLRREAERLRVLEKFYKGNISISKIKVPANLSDEVKAIEEKYAGLSKPAVNNTQARNKLTELANDQITYHQKERPELQDQLYHFLEKSHFYLFLLFIGGVALHAISILFCYDDMYTTGLLLSLGIPPLYAASEAYINFKEYHKIFYDSAKMLAFFNDIKDKLERIDVSGSNASDEIDRYANEIRIKMDEEISEWEELLKRKENPGPS